MDNKIISGGQHDISFAASHEIEEILHPLIREIHLYDTWIAGIAQMEDKSILRALKENEELLMQREKNEFDSNAILIMNNEMQKLGYVPEKDNTVFARLMDAGKTLKAKVIRVREPRTGLNVSIGIFLVDL